MKRMALFLTSFLFAQDVFAHGMTEADKAKALTAGYWEYIELGAGHMITGYDHLLFLFGVIFFLTKFKAIVKFITAFTLGHCITLIFATLYGIKANYFLVDAVIALTVCYKGFDNLDGFKRFLHVKSPNLMWMVFIFGLIHGFGLSTRLQKLPLADEGLILRILSFNVGVEVGQIAALTVMLLVLSGWRKSSTFLKFINAANATLVFVGFMLLLLQLHGFQHTKFVEDFPLNKDDHKHIHQDMDAASKTAPLEGYERKFDLSPSVHEHEEGKPHAH
jgi:hypothetical protein